MFGQRPYLQQHVFGRRLRHVRQPRHALLRGKQVQRQFLLLQRTVRGRIDDLRERRRRRHQWNERNRWNQRRRVHGRKMFWVRRLWPALLRNQLWRRPFLPQQHLFVLW
jgi:hypothetical protein